MDVLYASLAQFLIPENLDLSHNSVLRGCDEQSVRSLNGCRVTDTILRMYLLGQWRIGGLWIFVIAALS
eukprot:scaffold330261_cov54-Tisochrysis_lutea.AAC.1